MCIFIYTCAFVPMLTHIYPHTLTHLHTQTFPPPSTPIYATFTYYISTYLHIPPGGDGGRRGLLRGRFRARGGECAHALLGLAGQRVGEVRLYCMYVCVWMHVFRYISYIYHVHILTHLSAYLSTPPHALTHTRILILTLYTYIIPIHTHPREHYREEETGRDMAHLNLTALLIHFGEQHLQVVCALCVCVLVFRRVDITTLALLLLITPLT